ncbi:hypothetical protein KI387_015462, partial [Taxus chinensis]
MEDGSTCVATLAERELARRSYILNRLLERNRALGRQDRRAKSEKPVSSLGGVEPETPLFYRTTPRVREYEEDLKHLQSLRAEVEQLGKTKPQEEEPVSLNRNSEKKEKKCTRVAQNRSNGDAKGGVPLLVKSSSANDGAPRPEKTVTVSPARLEENLAAVAAALKIRVKAADMPAVLQERAFRCARQCLDSMDKLNSKRVAFILKKEFDTSYGHAWHCIVGTSFGSFVTHSLGGFLYFSVDK